jgi:hypothetical protein
MNERLIYALFESERDILNVTRSARAGGYCIVDVHTPYAVHGLEKEMGLSRSRLPWVTFIFGMAGALFMFWFQHWTSALNWAVDVGGRPWNSLPAFAPVAFESAVLCGGLSIVAALFISCRLYPGKKVTFPIATVTDHQFVLVVNVSKGQVSQAAFEQLCRQNNTVEMIEEYGQTFAGCAKC